MVREIDLDKASERDQIRLDDRVAAEVVTIANRRVLVWYQSPFYDFEGCDRFSMSENVLRQVPDDVTDFYVKHGNDGYFYKREDIETALRIDPFDPYFNERPDAPQYAAPIADARDTFEWSGPKNESW